MYYKIMFELSYHQYFCWGNLFITHQNSHALITDILIYVMCECP